NNNTLFNRSETHRSPKKNNQMNVFKSKVDSYGATRLPRESETDETLHGAKRRKRLGARPQEALLCAKAKRQRQSE
ncbi:hypothetical protein, partial [Lysinibacillus xylanilyticus]|uniref:hypothetical protein n=1 Tax=Lysinibacillus xylanilyticus TaxID=582475 RepID=UPI003D087E71